MIIATKKAVQSTVTDINKVCDLPELEVPPIPVDNNKKDNEQQTVASTSVLTDKALFMPYFRYGWLMMI